MDEAPPERGCPNCGAPAPGRFCPVCGQRQDRRLASVRLMAAEAAHDQFSLGAELPRTLFALFLRPGFLTAEYLAGRIARYLPPLRLYLVASLAFFFLVSWSTDDFETAFDEGDEPAAQAEADPDPDPDATPDSVGNDSSIVQLNLGDDDPFRVSVRLDTTDVYTVQGRLRRWVQHRVDRVNAMPEGEFERRFFAGLERNAPRAVFMLLPIYALLLKLLYVRGKWLYAEHFIFALHTHAFAFFLFCPTFVLPDWADNLALMVWLPIYLFFAMRRVYGQPLPKTIFKYLALFFLYASAQLVVLIGTAIVTAFTV